MGLDIYTVYTKGGTGYAKRPSRAASPQPVRNQLAPPFVSYDGCISGLAGVRPHVSPSHAVSVHDIMRDGTVNAFGVVTHVVGY